ncbi:MAG: hypothetical protein ACXWUN_03120 [Allosphingosinicella sp.]
MALGRTIIVWIFRHLLALVLILIILIIGRYAFEPATDWLRAQIEESRSVPRQRQALVEVRDAFEQYSRRRQAEVERSTRALARSPEAPLRRRRAQIDGAIAREQAARLSGVQLALVAARGDSGRIFAHYRAGTEIALLSRERDYIDALLAASSGGRSGLEARRRQAAEQLHASYRRWGAADERVRALNRRFLAGPRNALCRSARPAVGCENYRAMAAARAERASALAANEAAQAAIRDIDRARRALSSARAAAAATDASAIFAAQRQPLEDRLRELDRAASDNWLLWIGRPVLETLPTALLILAIAIFGPGLIKALMYFVVAPVAARRPPIRLVLSDQGVVTDQGGPSAASQRVPLDAGVEMLVLPEALQSTPHDAAKATKGLLNWSMPLSSLASGMVALVRIRTRRADFVQLSSTHDPLAEIATVAIAAGSAMSLRPRALRGIVQPIDRPVRITRHWRVGRLSAWLTLQFRYLVFHGPCTLILQGSRGVRLERAAAGRGINQAATLGFSAGLDYSVRRSEAFGAYLMGRQELFNDSFEAGEGCYLYEVLPRERNRGGIWGRGLQGLGDAALKIFGI